MDESIAVIQERMVHELASLPGYSPEEAREAKAFFSARAGQGESQ